MSVRGTIGCQRSADGELPLSSLPEQAVSTAMAKQERTKRGRHTNMSRVYREEEISGKVAGEKIKCFQNALKMLRVAVQGSRTCVRVREEEGFFKAT